MRNICCLLLIAGSLLAARAQMVVGTFSPIFEGVDLAIGTNLPNTTIPRLQAVRCVRLDLSNPNVRLFTTPPGPSPDTLSLTVSNYLKQYGLAVAVNGNSFNPSSPSTEGQTTTVDGLLVCTGRVVSVADNASLAALLFTTNKEPSFQLPNYPPGISVAGILNAVTGLYPILTNGVNIWTNHDYSNTLATIYMPGDPSIHNSQPRTAFGISQDKRYMFLMTIDGRQSGYSDGAFDGDTGLWLLAFGAWDAINMDGGGSTAMYMADCSGNPIAINHSSYPATVRPPHERNVGAHLGVYAPPLAAFIYNVVAVPGSTTATITWDTESNSTSQVEYGFSTTYGSISPLDSTMVSSHTVTLSNLSPARQYYYRVLSTTAAGSFASPCALAFTTTNAAPPVLAFGLTNVWRWETNNLDGINWRAAAFDDSAWSRGTGTLWAASQGASQTGIPSLNTRLPVNPATTYPFVTYYFRTHFNFPGSPAGTQLTFTNYLDDGAVIYLNGVEVHRAYLPAGAANGTLANGYFCSGGNATCPYVVTIAGDLVTNVLSGDNVLAVEVHNYATTSPDITFGQILTFPAPAPIIPTITNLAVTPGETNVTITWQTAYPATTQVQYGTNTSLGSATVIDSTLVTNHTAAITGLAPLTQYSFRAISSNSLGTATSDGTFATVPFYQLVLPLTATWRYTTNDLSAVNWMAAAYDDASWSQGAGLLAVEDNPDVAPQSTVLPSASPGVVFPTYYFRTHFTVPNWGPGFTLLFSNFVDDGAVFYLNGQEVYRLRMPDGAPAYTTLATGCAADRCDATREVPDLFRAGGDIFKNITAGDNVLAVEVHQLTAADPDVVLGSSVGLSRSLASETKLTATLENNVLKLTWAGSGMTLQNAGLFRQTNTLWFDVQGPAKTSPYYLTNPPSGERYYRLRN